MATLQQELDTLSDQIDILQQEPKSDRDEDEIKQLFEERKDVLGKQTQLVQLDKSRVESMTQTEQDKDDIEVAKAVISGQIQAPGIEFSEGVREAIIRLQPSILPELDITDIPTEDEPIVATEVEDEDLTRDQQILKLNEEIEALESTPFDATEDIKEIQRQKADIPSDTSQEIEEIKEVLESIPFDASQELQRQKDEEDIKILESTEIAIEDSSVKRDPRLREFRILQGTVEGIRTGQPTTAQEKFVEESDQEITSFFKKILDEEKNDGVNTAEELSTKFDMPLVSGSDIESQRTLIASQRLGREISALSRKETIKLEELRLSFEARNISPFETPEFNRETIKNTIEQNIGLDGSIDHLSMLNDLKDIMQIGFEQSLSTDNLGNDSMRAIGTLASALHEVHDEIKATDPDLLISIAEKAVTDLVGKTGLQQLLLPPEVDDEKEIISTTKFIFKEDIRDLLDTKKLTFAQIQNIKKDYSDFLLDLTNQILLGKIDDVPLRLSILDDYLDQNIKNTQLKEILQRDLFILKQRLLMREGMVVGSPSATILPISAIKQISIQSSLGRELLGAPIEGILKSVDNLKNSFGLTLEDLRKVQKKVRKPVMTGKPGRPALVETDADEVLSRNQEAVRKIGHLLVEGIKNLNLVSKNNNIMIKEEGRRERLFSINLRKTVEQKRVTKNVFELLNELEKMKKLVSLQTTTFSRLDQQVEDIPILAKQRFSESIKSIQSIPKRKSRSLKTKVPRPTGLTKLGAIKIFSSETDNIKEIEIPQFTKTGDLIKLATILTMEDGILEDIDGNVLVEILQQQDDVGNIVNAIVGELHQNLGHTVKLIYIPDHLGGGHFLDGFLSSIHKRPFISKSLGGGITDSGYFKEHPLWRLSQVPLSSYSLFQKK